ncbi:Flp family type IVb pilin [Herminiimonas sp. CN]|uniref:Flp family type IVb pilin n=1 Tax=Herminiimonas sp. CN TaxID=1349818 RepID=UPI0004735D45|nr:Flp family type IVb pilin [Herminiimonas sp. CN]
MNAIKNFMRDEEGAVAIEYGLLAALIAIAIIAGATQVGTCINGLFTNVAAVLAGGTWAPPTC